MKPKDITRSFGMRIGIDNCQFHFFSSRTNTLEEGDDPEKCGRKVFRQVLNDCFDDLERSKPSMEAIVSKQGKEILK